ncbi:MAG: hypothetical protein Q8K21_13005 [Hydrogenophaga sp.]|uniref:hypothetical protein n=1 Tax=Hydrogenophaga sp. TaxID=1904254 RepID=UPI00273095CB|nr:hypothetical protein [Hydrogenophaga sp.]MDP2165111.1 hypothetical protein [Hydrogenophaga sp.]MDP3476851.1 hypothetical protein [Hydrogenophaga sp.]
MSLVIAILLALILVAMVSSNKAAATGVWTVIRFALWGALAVICWGLFIGYFVWLEEVYPSGASEWMQVGGLLCVAMFPPVYLWLSRKSIADAYKKDKWTAIKGGLTYAGYVVLWMVGMVLVREVQMTVPNGGWLLILLPLVGIGSVLIFRTLLNPRGWREVWLGPPPLPEPWEVVAAEGDAFQQAERAAFPDWSDWTVEQIQSWKDDRTVREIATEKRLQEMRKRLEAEKAERTRSEAWSMRGFFYLFSLLAAFGLLGILWDFAFDYAMGLAFVKGQAWLAGATVVGAALVLGGLGVSALESIGQKK